MFLVLDEHHPHTRTKKIKIACYQKHLSVQVCGHETDLTAYERHETNPYCQHGREKIKRRAPPTSQGIGLYPLVGKEHWMRCHVLYSHPFWKLCVYDCNQQRYILAGLNTCWARISTTQTPSQDDYIIIQVQVSHWLTMSSASMLSETQQRATHQTVTAFMTCFIFVMLIHR